MLYPPSKHSSPELLTLILLQNSLGHHRHQCRECYGLHPLENSHCKRGSTRINNTSGGNPDSLWQFNYANIQL